MGPVGGGIHYLSDWRACQIPPEQDMREIPAQHTDRYVFLDILRGLAVLGVIWHHAYFSSLSSAVVNFEFFGLQIYPLIFNNGWLGVNIFFVLSGFVLFNPNFLINFEIKKYYKRRVLRLIPLYLFFIVVIGIIDGRSVLFIVWNAILLTTGVHNIYPPHWHASPFLSVFWSLGVEILFSIGLPAFILAFRRFGFWEIIITVIVLSTCYKIFADILSYRLWPNYSNPLINPLKDNIFGRIDDFAVGMAASFVFSKGWRPSQRQIWSAILVLLVTLYAWNVIFIISERPIYLSVIVSFLHPAFSVSLSILVIWLLPKIIWQQKSFIPIVLLGHIVYSAYIVHAFLRKYFNFDFDNLFSVLLYLVLVYGISIITFLLIEIHGIGKKPRWAARVWSRA